jgi:uncharacterized protein YhfF
MNTENIKKFWQNFLSHKGLDDSTTFLESGYFGDNKELANELLALVLSGQKRATASVLKAYELEGTRVPAVGDYSIITDWDGNPHCVIQTKTVTILPFNEMTYDICKREGEDDCLETWQEGHIRCFTDELKALGASFTEDMPIIFEDFDLVFVGTVALGRPMEVNE